MKIAAFASGRGSNLLAIIKAIHRDELACEVVLVISNNSNSGALNLARDNRIPALFITREQFNSDEDFTERLLDELRAVGTELIILAGYLKKINSPVIQAYHGRILNIHPALLPSFGGKGMYGMNVHKAVLEYGCKVSGVTVHLVDEQYDSGPPIIQKCVPVKEGDTPELLAERILQQEHQVYAQALQLFAEGRVEMQDRKVIIRPAN